jgi:hypothetical protein
MARRRHTLPGLDCQITFADNDGQPVMYIRQEHITQTATRTP